jgi:hypothetical protein
MPDPLINMRERADQCRRLAALTHDDNMAKQLRQWADEIDADIQRLEAERRGQNPAE